MIEKVNTNGRQTGRTTELIYKCEQYKNALIVCPNRAIAEYTFDMARDKLINIPMPITFKEFAEGIFAGRNIDAILIDNLEMVLNDMARGVPIAEVVLMDQGRGRKERMDKKEILDILDNAKDERGAVPMRLVRQAFDKLVQPEERMEKRTETHACDSLSRQDAIDALKICDNNEDGINCYKCPIRDERWDGPWQDDETSCYRKLMRDSAELLSAQPEQRWILCDERMPEEHEWIGTKQFGTTMSDEVYVTFENQKGERFTRHLHFHNGDLSRYDKTHMDAWFKKDYKPIAWMPLPEPYKAEAERRPDDKTDKGSSC